jgi:MFS family permease
MFGLLYFVQGAALAYFRNFQKPYLDGLQIDPDTIGFLTSILLLPFILKIFIGMVSDRVNLLGMGHRKPYMILGLFLAALAFAGGGLVLPDQNFVLFAVLVVAGSFSVTLFDSTTDGLAIDTTPPEHQGTIQGVMVGGRAVGFILLSWAFGEMVETQGYRVVFFIIAVSMLVPLLWVIGLREAKQRAETRSFQWAAFKSLTQPRFLIFSLYAILYSFVSFGVDGLVTFFMKKELQATSSLIGRYGSLRGIGAVVGALVAGLLIDRFGRRRSAYAAIFLISLGSISIGLAGQARTVLALGVAWGIVWAFQETLFFALAMGLTDSRIAASMFAIMMAISNLGTAITEGVSTGLTDNLGFSAVFWLLAGVNILTLPVLWGLFRIAPEIQDRNKSDQSGTG